MTSSEKRKFVWDEKLTELYIQICVHEVRAGNRPTTHLNKKGWTNVQEKFAMLAKKQLDMKQLKNKWDNLKKDWQTWKRLIGKETGLGWNSEKKTIEASGDWWDQKIKEIPAAAKFRDKGLLLPDEMDMLFGDVAATGQHAWTPSSGALPDAEGLDTYLEGSGDSDDIEATGQPSEQHIEQSDARAKGKGKRIQSSGSASKSRKKQSPVDSYAHSLDRLSGVVEAVKRSTDSGVETCVEIVESLNIKDEPDFYYDCLCAVSREKDMRRVLLCLQDSETRLGFLRHFIADRKK